MTNSETVSVERLDELQEALNEGRILSVLMESDLAAMLSALRTQPAQPVNEPGEWQVEAACRSFIPQWDACTDEVKQDCRRDMRQALRAASIPAEAQGREAKAWLNPNNGAISRQQTRNNTVPLYATPPAPERSKEEVGVKVKPLAWLPLSEYGPDAEQASGILAGLYGVFPDDDSAAGAIFAEWAETSAALCTTGAKSLGRFHDWEAAKDAAQADYEQRILSALEPASLHKGEAERCFICNEPFTAGEMVLSDVTEGLGHRACFGEDRDGYVNLQTGEPIAADEPIPTGWPYEPDASPAPLPVTITDEHILDGARGIWDAGETGLPFEMAPPSLVASLVGQARACLTAALSVKPSGEEG